MRTVAVIILSAILAVVLVACQSIPVSDAPRTPATPDIGVAMPTQSIQCWEQDGQDIKKQLESKGYSVDLQYADQYASNQSTQIQDMLARGCKVLVVALYDSGALHTVLAKAKAAGVTVIAYHFPIMNAADVDYYVAFDAFRRSALQAEYIEKALGVKDGKGPFNIELFTGSPDDGNIGFFYEGAMSVLRPYIESGRLVVKSGQVDLMQVGTWGYKTEKAKARMDDILKRYYTGDKLDAVLALTDGIASGVIASLEDAGYTRFPIITGMDCEKPNVLAMKAGKQSMSVFLDTHILTAKVVEVVDAVMTGREVPPTSTAEHRSNGRTFVMSHHVPSFLCDPAVVTVDNIRQVLVDGGYYTEAELEE